MIHNLEARKRHGEDDRTSSHTNTLGLPSAESAWRSSRRQVKNTVHRLQVRLFVGRRRRRRRVGGPRALDGSSLFLRGQHYRDRLPGPPVLAQRRGRALVVLVLLHELLPVRDLHQVRTRQTVRERVSVSSISSITYLNEGRVSTFRKPSVEESGFSTAGNSPLLCWRPKSGWSRRVGPERAERRWAPNLCKENKSTSPTSNIEWTNNKLCEHVICN